jgi:outer membrane protein TolC
MMNVNFRRASLPIALAIAAATAHVRAEAPAKLKALLEEAIHRHPTIRSSERMADAASEMVSREEALPDPMLSVGAQNLRVDKPRLSADPMSGIAVMITQDVPLPGKRGRRGAVASANADASRRDARVAVVAIALRVEQAYWRLQYAEEAEHILRDGVEILDHLLESTRARFSLGQAAQQDVLQAEVARGRAVAMLEERKQMIVTTRRELNAAVGRSPETPLGPTEAPPENVALDRSGLVAAAGRANPDLLAAVARATAAMRAVDEASYDRWPDLQLGAGYMFRAAVPGDPANGADMFSASIGVTLPLWIARKQDARVREARQSLAAAQANVETASLTTATAVESALDVVERLTREIALFETTVAPRAEQAVASGTAEYSVGKTQFIALLASWQALLDARVDIARLRSERAQAIAEARALAGATDLGP